MYLWAEGFTQSGNLCYQNGTLAAYAVQCPVGWGVTAIDNGIGGGWPYSMRCVDPSPPEPPPPSEPPPSIVVGRRPVTPTSVTLVSATETGSPGRSYSFTLASRHTVSVSLTGMNRDMNCSVNGSSCSNRGGTSDDDWSRELAAGSRSVRVYPYGGGRGDYTIAAIVNCPAGHFAFGGACHRYVVPQQPTGAFGGGGSEVLSCDDNTELPADQECVDGIVVFKDEITVTDTAVPRPPPPPPPPPPPQELDVVLRAYIPSAWVPSPPSLRCLSMIFGGDDRGPSATPPARTVPTDPVQTLEPYRLEASLVLAVTSEQSALRLLSESYSAGLTTHFHRATTLADGVVDDNDYDEEGDCHRLHRTDRLGGTVGSATLPGGAALALELGGANPLVFPPVEINASLELNFRTSATDGLIIDGEIAHDCMPAFELYIEGAAAYSWAPSAGTLGSQVRIALCLAPPKTGRGRFECTENSQGGFTCRGQ